ncbi:MAG: A/G-specific adenine glycosylase, partial [Luteolibacter sp.]
MKPEFQIDPLDHADDFRSALRRWFLRHGRELPWRRTQDPYAILVSEVMLQQTQIATVLGKGYYVRFLERFPDLASLAAADDRSLLKAWEGLGYYRRARMLRETARAVIERHEGSFPHQLDELMALPGIGRYTAGALRAFAFGLPAVVVDGNVSRVLARIMDFADPVDQTAAIRQLWGWAEILADPEHPREHHAAMMELGQTHCRPGVPDCLACPVSRFCCAQNPAALPAKKNKSSITEIEEHALWVRGADQHLLLHHESGPRRTGFWKLPLREASALSGHPIISQSQYPITRYRVSLHVHHAQLQDAIARPREGDSWVADNDLPDLPLAATYKPVILALIE